MSVQELYENKEFKTLFSYSQKWRTMGEWNKKKRKDAILPEIVMRKLKFVWNDIIHERYKLYRILRFFDCWKNEQIR
jgi:hypothetical protein